MQTIRVIKPFEVTRGVRADKFFIEINRDTIARLRLTSTVEKDKFARWLMDEVYNALYKTPN